MDQAPRFAALTPATVRRRRVRVPCEPAVPAFVARPGVRENLRFFLYAYVSALIVFLTWLA